MASKKPKKQPKTPRKQSKRPTKRKVVEQKEPESKPSWWDKVCAWCRKAFDAYMEWYAKSLREHKNLSNIVLTSIVALFLMFLTLFTVGVIKDTFPPNFDPFFLNAVQLVLLIILFFLVLFMYTLSNREDYRWITTYTVMIVILYAISTIAGYSPILAGILLLIVGLTLFPYFNNNWKNPNSTILTTIIVILIVFSLGLLMIHEVYGSKEIDWHLNDCETREQVEGLNIQCVCVGNKMIAGYMIHCHLTEPHHNITAVARFQREDDSWEEKEINDLSFEAPRNIERIEFFVNGTDAANESRCYSTAWNYRFPTYEEYYQNKEHFLTYLLGLFFLCFITIPPLIIKLSNYVKEDGESK